MTEKDKIQLVKDKFIELFGVEVRDSDIRIIIETQIISDNNIAEAVVLFDLKTNSRKRKLVYMRAYLSNLLYRRGHNLGKIGKLFNRDHSTIIHYLKLYDNFKEDKYFINTIEPLTNFLRNNNHENTE